MPERIRRPLVRGHIAAPWVYTVLSLLCHLAFPLGCIGLAVVVLIGKATLVQMAAGSLLYLVAVFLLAVLRDIMTEVAREAPLVVLMNPESFTRKNLQWALEMARLPQARNFFKDHYSDENIDHLIVQAQTRLK